MQVFLSWSGGRSKKTADVLSNWLKQVIQALEPWMSSDIEKGKRWSLEMSDKLEKSTAGIICLNRDNLDERWILFEAGALSKMIHDSYVCTFLLDISHEDIEPPLSDFQNTKFDKEDMRKLVHTLNTALSNTGEKPLEEKILDAVFETYWPPLEKDLTLISEEKPQKSEPARSQKEILVEILEIVRSLNRKTELDRYAAQLVSLKSEELNKAVQVETLRQALEAGPKVPDERPKVFIRRRLTVNPDDQASIKS